MCGIKSGWKRRLSIFLQTLTGDKIKKKHVYCCYVQASYPVFLPSAGFLPRNKDGTLFLRYQLHIIAGKFSSLIIISEMEAQ